MEAIISAMLKYQEELWEAVGISDFSLVFNWLMRVFLRWGLVEKVVLLLVLETKLGQGGGGCLGRTLRRARQRRPCPASGSGELDVGVFEHWKKDRSFVTFEVFSSSSF